jgi:hypothetical protein
MSSLSTDFKEINKMFKYDSVSHFTGFHENKGLFLDSAFTPYGTFTDKMVVLSRLKMLGKIMLLTVASAGFGVVMGLIMSSFEFNATMGIDTNRSTRSQLKQHFFGYSRFLKR